MGGGVEEFGGGCGGVTQVTAYFVDNSINLDLS